MTHATAPSPFTIVVGVDGSDGSQAALAWAIEEARFRHARVHAIHAWTTPYDWQADVVIFPIDDERLRQAAQHRLDAALAEIDAGDVFIEGEVVEGDARRVLVDAARDAGLLVVGSHGAGRVTDAVLGSVSTHCVHHATCPVVVVRGVR